MSKIGTFAGWIVLVLSGMTPVRIIWYGVPTVGCQIAFGDE